MRVLRITRADGSVDVIAGIAKEVYVPVEPGTPKAPTLIEMVEAEGVDEARAGAGEVLASGAPSPDAGFHQYHLALPKEES